MEKVKTAVIGIGNMGTAHAQSLWDDRVPGLALAAVCDTDPARLAYAAKAWPGVACYASEDALLAAGGVQAAIVAVPHPLHSKIASLALAAGLHVLVEKPLDVRLSVAQALCAQAKASGKVFALMLNQRTNPLFAKARAIVQAEDLWKNQIITNPKINSYGNGGAEIIDFLLADDLENPTNQILKGYECIIKMKVKFNRQVEDPIFAITIVNLQGTEVCGTNTMYESVNTGICNEGDIKVVEFKQKLNLAGGNYLISFGCTGYENGEFVVYHRLYEMVNLQIVSSKNTVGYFDMNSKVTVE